MWGAWLDRFDGDQSFVRSVHTLENYMRKEDVGLVLSFTGGAFSILRWRSFDRLFRSVVSIGCFNRLFRSVVFSIGCFGCFNRYVPFESMRQNDVYDFYSVLQEYHLATSGDGLLKVSKMDFMCLIWCRWIHKTNDGRNDGRTRAHNLFWEAFWEAFDESPRKIYDFHPHLYVH